MNVACDHEAPMQMLTTEKYIAAGGHLYSNGGNHARVQKTRRNGVFSKRGTNRAARV